MYNMYDQKDVENERLKKSAFPLPEPAQKANMEVVDKIRDSLDGFVFKTNVYQSKSLGSVGRIFYENYNPSILIERNVADFLHTISYHAFRSFNNEKNPDPRDFFKYALAHEYGHVILTKIEKKCRPVLSSYSTIHLPGFTEYMEEGFAFWFGDKISGFKTPTEIIESYDNHDKIKKIYNDLEGMDNRIDISKIITYLRDARTNCSELTINTGKEFPFDISKIMDAYTNNE